MDELKATRQGYGDAVLELARKDKRIVALAADLAGSLKLGGFIKEFPDRFFQVGISEADMVGIAAGLASTGKIPFVSTFAEFAIGRPWEQIRQSVCYSNLHVIIGGSHSGLSLGEDGATHQILEDIALTRVLPNMKVIVPCDYEQTKRVVFAAANESGPCYIRFSRPKTPVFTTGMDFELGKAQVLRQGNDISIIACGLMVHRCLKAADVLAESGISAGVVNLHTIKPLDKEAIIKAADTGRVLTVEEHQENSGMGSAVAEVLSQNRPTKMKILGVKDTFGESGKPDELLDKYGLSVENIVKNARELLV